MNDDEECTTCALTFLIHGESKAGKSTFAATAPLPILVLDVEKGWDFVPRSKPIKAIHGRSLRMRNWNPIKEAMPAFDGTWDVCRVPVTEWKTVQMAYKHLNERPHEFRSVVLDSVSRVQGRLMRAIAPDPENQMQQQAWGTLLRVMEDTIQNYRDLAAKPESSIRVVVFTAETVKTGMPEQYRPSMQGSVRDKLPYMVDVAGFLFKSQTKGETGVIEYQRNLLISGHDPRFLAGSRVEDILGASVEEPNITKMLAEVYEDTE